MTEPSKKKPHQTLAGILPTRIDHDAALDDRLDEEARRRNANNPRLNDAIAEMQADLRPGEDPLYWDIAEPDPQRRRKTERRLGRPAAPPAEPPAESGGATEVAAEPPAAQVDESAERVDEPVDQAPTGLAAVLEADRPVEEVAPLRTLDAPDKPPARSWWRFEFMLVAMMSVALVLVAVVALVLMRAPGGRDGAATAAPSSTLAPPALASMAVTSVEPTAVVSAAASAVPAGDATTTAGAPSSKASAKPKASGAPSVAPAPPPVPTADPVAPPGASTTKPPAVSTSGRLPLE